VVGWRGLNYYGIPYIFLKTASHHGWSSSTDHPLKTNRLNGEILWSYLCFVEACKWI
jgi:hypothetical protein